MSSAGPVELRLPERILADVGVLTPVRVVLTETSGRFRTVMIRVLGNLGGPLPATTVALEPRASVEVEVSVSIPHGMPPGNHPYLFEVVDRETGAVLVAAEATVDVQHTKAVSINVVPQSIRRRRSGRIRIVVRNHDDEAHVLRLVPESDDSETSVDIVDPEVSVRPGEMVRVRGRVKARPFYIGKQRERWYSVIGSGAGVPVYARGNLRQKPMVGRNIKGTLGLLTILVVWAAATVSVIRLVSPATTESTAGAEGSGTSVPGDGEGEVPPLTPVLIDVTGTVTATPDGSGVVVSWRPVSIGDVEGSGKVAAGSTVSQPDVTLNRTETDQDGAFVVAGLDSMGLFEFSFSKAGHQTKTIIVQPNGLPVTLEINLEAGDGFIGGRAIDDDGNPIGGVDITLSDGNITYSASTPTDGDSKGGFGFANLSSPATYVLDARVAGRGLASTTIDLATGQSLRSVTLVLSPNVATLAGKIAVAAFEATAAPLDYRAAPFDTVAARSPSFTITATDGTLTRSTTTLTEGALAGTFRLEQLPVGRTYTVTYSAPGFTTLTEQLDLTLDTPERKISMIRSTGRLRGTVTVSGSRLSPTSVAVTVTNPDFTYKTTDAISSDGSLLVDGIEPGHYVVVFEALGLVDQVREVDIGAGTSTTLDVTMEGVDSTSNNSSISFTVIQGGDPVDRTTVTAEIRFHAATDCGAVGSDTDCEYTVPSDGNLTIDGLDAGSYVVTFEADGFFPTAKVVPVAKDAAAEAVEVLMIPLGSLQGLVSDDTATPVQGIELTLKDEDGVEVDTATTDSNGEYLFKRQLLPKTYSVEVISDSFAATPRSVIGALSATLNLDVTVRGLSILTGEVRTLDFQTAEYVTVPSAEFNVYLREGAVTEPWQDATQLGLAKYLGGYRLGVANNLDASGTLTSPPGVYAVCVVVIANDDLDLENLSDALTAYPTDPDVDHPCDTPTDDYQRRTAENIEVALTEVATRSFYLTPDPGTIEGVVRVNGTAQADITVEARRIDASDRVIESLSTTTEAGGFYSFTSLTPVRASVAGTDLNDETVHDECNVNDGACWIIRATAQGVGFKESDEYVIYPGSDFDIDDLNIVQTLETSLTVTVVDSNGNNVNNASVQSTTGDDCGDTGASSNTCVITDPVVGQIATITVTASGYRTGRASIGITSGTLAITVVLTKAYSAAVTVNKDSTGVNGITIDATDSTGTTATCTDGSGSDPADGTCTITELAPGITSLEISGTGITTTNATIAISATGAATQTFTIDLDATPTLIVTAIDTTGAPISGVTISGTIGTCAATTDASGNCTINSTAIGSTGTVIATKTGYRTATTSTIIRNINNTLTITLTKTFSAQITVTKNATTSNGITITATDSTGATDTCTDGTAPDIADGTCTISGLAPGVVLLQVSKTGISSTNAAIVISPTEDSTQIFSIDVETASIAGTVSNGDSGVVGATVTFTLDGSSPAIVRSVATDVDGAYYVSGLEPGTWTITVSAVGYSAAYGSSTVTEGGTITAKNFTLSALSGTLVLTISTVAGTALSSIDVTVYSSSSKVTTITTGQSISDGTATISGLTPGQYWIRVADSQSPARFSAQEFLVNIDAGYTTALPVHMGSTRSIVVLGIAGIPAVGFGPALPLDLKIRLVPTGSGSNQGPARTSAAFGRSTVTFSDVPNGSYDVEVDASDPSDLTSFTPDADGVIVVGGVTYTIPTLDEITVPGPTTFDAGLILLPQKTVGVTINVKNAANVAVQSATVRVSDGYLLAPVEGTTNSSGDASMGSVPPGTYTVEVSGVAGSDVKRTSITVADASSGNTQTFSVSLADSTEPVSLPVTVSDSGGYVGGATVTAVQAGRSCVTNTSGACSILVSPGTYTLSTTKSGYTTNTMAGVVVSPDGSTTATITISTAAAGSGGVRFVLVDDSGTDLTGATVELVDGSVSCSAGTGAATNEYTCSGLPIEPTTFRVSKSGHGTAFASLTPVDGVTTDIDLELVADPPAPSTSAVVTFTIRDATTGSLITNVDITNAATSASVCSTNGGSSCSSSSITTPASLTFKAAKTGYEDGYASVVLVENTATSVTITLRPTTAATGSVLLVVTDRRTGGAVSGVGVASTSGTIGCASSNTDSDGKCSISGVTAGTATITLTLSGYQTVTAYVQVAANSSNTVNLTMIPVGSATITLPGAAASAVTISLVGISKSCTVAISGTSCTINDIPYGSWLTSATGYQQATLSVLKPTGSGVTLVASS